MTREWIDNAESEFLAQKWCHESLLKGYIKECPFFNDEKRKRAGDIIDGFSKGFQDTDFKKLKTIMSETTEIRLAANALWKNEAQIPGLTKAKKNPDTDDYAKYGNAGKILSSIPRHETMKWLAVRQEIDLSAYMQCLLDIAFCESLSDSIKIEIKGGIVITDPYCIAKDEADWEKMQGGSRLDAVGINTFLCVPTFTQSFVRNVVSMQTASNIGTVECKSGAVCIADLNEVIKYRPEFGVWSREHQEYCFVNPGFSGKAWFCISSCMGMNGLDFMPEAYTAPDKGIGFRMV